MGTLLASILTRMESWRYVAYYEGNVKCRKGGQGREEEKLQLKLNFVEFWVVAVGSYCKVPNGCGTKYLRFYHSDWFARLNFRISPLHPDHQTPHITHCVSKKAQFVQYCCTSTSRQNIFEFTQCKISRFHCLHENVNISTSQMLGTLQDHMRQCTPGIHVLCWAFCFFLAKMVECSASCWCRVLMRCSSAMADRRFGGFGRVVIPCRELSFGCVLLLPCSARRPKPTCSCLSEGTMWDSSKCSLGVMCPRLWCAMSWLQSQRNFVMAS